MKPNIFRKIILWFTVIMMMTSVVQAQELENENIKAKVLKITDDRVEENKSVGLSNRIQEMRVELLNGSNKGEIINVENNISLEMAYNMIIEEGDEVILQIERDEQGNITNTYVAEFVRDKYLLYIFIIFVIIIVLIGGFKGLKSLLSLIITAFLIIKIMIPAILEGKSPVLMSVIVAVISTILTIILISGINKKAIAAICGTSGGVISAGIIASLFMGKANLTGLSLGETQMLSVIPQGTVFDFKGLLFAGIILGALGAAMDVSISIASSLNEIKVANSLMTRNQLFKAGMNVGKDIMGTMTNTLILAYAGASLNLMILFLAYEMPLSKIMNMDMIASEVVRALAGTIGLMFTIPLTAIIAAYLNTNKDYYDIK